MRAIWREYLSCAASFLLCVGLLPASTAARPAPGQRSGKTDAEQHFRKWLTEDAVYIISPEEKEIYSKLTTAEEKESFIEQFWSRRDPDSNSAENEFKIEHYRRIQFANDWFRSGEAGWKTDRGRIYIMYGPATEVTRYGGGQYERSMTEGGGVTTTYPFEKWVYRRIEGIGDYVELEFVDETLSGEYRLAMSPHEKDALLNVPNAGLTLEEALGLVPKSDRVRNLYAGNPQPGPFTAPGFRDSLFERLNTYFSMQRPPSIQFKDLKEVVTTSVRYDLVPFQIRTDWIYLDHGQALVPVTLKIENQDLTYVDTLGVQRATVNVYGCVRSLQGQIAAEFEDTVTSDYTADTFGFRSFQNSVYQKQVRLKPGLYRLDVAVKDVSAGKTGTLQARLQIPSIHPDKPVSSPLILAKRTEDLRAGAHGGLFEIGDVKIIPEVGDSFSRRDTLHFYVQLYNISRDQASGRPSLRLSYTVRSAGGATLVDHADEEGDLVHYHSPQRVVCLGRIPLKDLVPGSYRLRLEATDLLAGHSVAVEASFQVVDPVDRPR